MSILQKIFISIVICSPIDWKRGRVSIEAAAVKIDVQNLTASVICAETFTYMRSVWGLWVGGYLTLIGMSYESKKNDVNFHLQESLDIFDKKSADKICSKKDRGWKVPSLMPIRVKMLKGWWLLSFIKLRKQTRRSKLSNVTSEWEYSFKNDFTSTVHKIFWFRPSISFNKLPIKTFQKSQLCTLLNLRIFEIIYV